MTNLVRLLLPVLPHLVPLFRNHGLGKHITQLVRLEGVNEGRNLVSVGHCA